MKSSKKIYQLMSILIAMSLWVYIVAEDNIFQEKTFTADVQYINLEESLTPLAKMPTVNISIKGDKIDINELRASDFSVFVDLEKATKGENEYTVQVEAPLDVRVVSVSPQTVFLSIDEVAEKQVPLEVNVSGKAKEGFSSFEPNLKTSHVTISGPQEMIKEITSAQVDVNINEADSNLSLMLIPRISTMNPNIDEDIITIKPGIVDIYIPVIEDNPSKSVPVVVPVTGIPSYGYKVSRIVVEPEIIRISGANEVIEGIREVLTTPVDISNQSSEILREVTLNIPGNIKSLYEGQLKVVILFEKNVVEKRIEKKLEIRNIPEGINLKASNEIISVVLRGEDLEFREFLSEDLRLYVDATNYKENSQEFQIKVEKPDTIEVIETRPSKTTLITVEEEN